MTDSEIVQRIEELIAQIQDNEDGDIRLATSVRRLIRKTSQKERQG